MNMKTMGSEASKKSKMDAGTLYTFGTGVCGQLGLGEDVLERRYPEPVQGLNGKKIGMIACGRMHTAVLDSYGKVWTFGLNDDSALGRKTEEEAHNFSVGVVDLRHRVVQISAGDSHTAALTEDGCIYVWGTFKNLTGKLGLIPGNERECWLEPQLISGLIGSKVTKIASGDNHLVILTEDRKIFTCGTGEQGQLGRDVLAKDDRRVTRRRAIVIERPTPIREVCLTPTEVEIPRRFQNIWCGSFSTYCLSVRNEIWVFGLNNYGQLGIDGENLIRFPAKSEGFRGIKVASIAAGQHHAVVLDEAGKVYTLGRTSEGRLGLGPSYPHKRDFVSSSKKVVGLRGQKSVLVSAGPSTAYAITNEGIMYAWGCGENLQLGTGTREDNDVPRPMEFMVRDSKEEKLDLGVRSVCAGGQHVAVILRQGKEDFMIRYIKLFKIFMISLCIAFLERKIEFS